MCNENNINSQSEKDLFEFYEDQPPELQLILKKYESLDNTYTVLDQLLKEVENIGFTFECDLNAMPYNLRAINETNK